MEYISAKEAAEKWEVSLRWVQKLCDEERIDGVERFGRSYMIPKNTQKPKDLRRKENKKAKTK